ncbi:MAG: hypothetical protein AMJ84_00760 [Acidithiobacillales bacterium SM23_46]|jgi:O-antigen/teichoic acid export membrane protein|nr:MAG: hypothetical protein AMS22_00355 [Thiotrichales bacterium SG8_50]KPK74090.1 MAG: hypothetical protein AMJ84_00760 [Acidithiobacillales bacterium SM23_46]
MLSKLFVHTSNYSIGNLLVMLAGFVSFPVFTRLLSVEDYGLLGLVSGTVALLTGVAKFGLQHSVVRFYADARAGKAGVTLGEYNFTVLTAMAATGLAVAVLWALASQVIAPSLLKEERIAGLFLLTSVLIVVRTVDSTLTNLLRAQERSAVLSAYTVIRKYVTVGTIVVVLLYLVDGAYGFFVATIAAETAMLGAALVLAVNRLGLPIQFTFSSKLLRLLFLFGLPMLGYDLAFLLLDIVSRYVIQAQLGSRQLGIYMASLNLTEYAHAILVSALNQSMIPMYLRLWAEKGEAETRKFIEESAHYYLLVAIPVAAGLSAAGGDLMVFLASEKFQAGSSIIPYLISAQMVGGAATLYGAGLYIHKQTLTLMWVVLGSVAVNLVVNLLLLPRIGIIGAGIAMLASETFRTVALALVNRRQFRLAFPFSAAAKFSLIAVVMYLLIVNISLGHGRIFDLGAKVAVGVISYALIVIVLDRRARSLVRRVATRLGYSG